MIKCGYRNIFRRILRQGAGAVESASAPPSDIIRPMGRLQSFASAACLIATAALSASAAVQTGIDILEATDFKALVGKRVGLITNQTGRDHAGRSTIEVFASSNRLEIKTIFVPEHGLKGLTEFGPISSSAVVMGSKTLPVVSLYKDGPVAPRADQLRGLDALVFDVQDVGARFYTYLTTMGLALEAAKKAGAEFYVLDRPNPLGGMIMGGPLPSPSLLAERRPTAFYAVPIRHGMTAGEIARLYNRAIRHPGLHVIKMKGWSRRMSYGATGLSWTPPSPNLPDFHAARFYVGIGIFESSNLAVGRGGTKPFQWIGAPWLDTRRLLRALSQWGPRGVVFVSQDDVPAENPYKGRPCRGLAMRITNRRDFDPLNTFLAVALALRDVHAKDFAFRWGETRRMVGTSRFRKLYERGAGLSEFQRLFDAGSFAKTRKTFLLY